MAEKKRKRTVVCLSSSSEDEEELESEGDDSDDDGDDSGASTYSEGTDDTVTETDDDEEDLNDDDDEDDEDDDDDDDGDDDDSICNMVIHLLQEGRDLKRLNVKECKVYLRKHDLRITGSKEECIERIKEHWRIKDGNGEVLYPESSFYINCTGDVCKGDVVLFTQKVYAKFDKVKRKGKFRGKRTIAGRIVKESYGAAKQQHTFTVEVLWSKGIKKLSPLSPLLVKGRNLYRLKTFRQPWKIEAERLQILDEKHKRGAAARGIRAKRNAKRTLSSTRGEGHQRNSSHRTKQPQKRGRTKSTKRKRVDEKGRSKVIGRAKPNNQSQNARPIGQANMKSRAPESSQWHQKPSYPSSVTPSSIQLCIDPAHNFYRFPRELHPVNTPHQFPSHDMAYRPNMMRWPPSWPCADSFVRPPPGHRGW